VKFPPTFGTTPQESLGFELRLEMFERRNLLAAFQLRDYTF
jgi:hypothetical protein